MGIFTMHLIDKEKAQLQCKQEKWFGGLNLFLILCLKVCFINSLVCDEVRLSITTNEKWHPSLSMSLCLSIIHP